VLPDGLMVLFGLAPAPPVVLPSMELPVVVELPAVPPAVELPPAVPAALPPAEPPPAPPPPPPPCASAKVELRAKIEASATVLSFMAVLSFSKRKNKETINLNVPKKIKILISAIKAAKLDQARLAPACQDRWRSCRGPPLKRIRVSSRTSR
jgi:hypothetical protein